MYLNCKTSILYLYFNPHKDLCRPKMYKSWGVSGGEWPQEEQDDEPSSSPHTNETHQEPPEIMDPVRFFLRRQRQAEENRKRHWKLKHKNLLQYLMWCGFTFLDSDLRQWDSSASFWTPSTEFSCGHSFFTVTTLLQEQTGRPCSSEVHMCPAELLDQNQVWSVSIVTLVPRGCDEAVRVNGPSAPAFFMLTTAPLCCHATTCLSVSSASEWGGLMERCAAAAVNGWRDRGTEGCVCRVEEKKVDYKSDKQLTDEEQTETERGLQAVTSV